MFSEIYILKDKLHRILCKPSLLYLQILLYLFVDVERNTFADLSSGKLLISSSYMHSTSNVVEMLSNHNIRG